MEDVKSVRTLIEVIYRGVLQNGLEIFIFNDDPLLTKHFPQRLLNILVMKEAIFHPQWESHLNTYRDIMFTSPTMYFKCVIFPCLTESSFHENVFEAFISVCALLKFFNEKILKDTGMNFRDLNTDVFMAVSDHILKRNFYKKGGLRQLAEYIHGHRYHSWNWGDLASTDATARDKIRNDIQVERFLNRHGTCRTVGEIEKMEATCGTLAQKVLSSTSVELPTLFNNPDLMKCLKASGESICSSSNSDSNKDIKASKNEENTKKSEKDKLMKNVAELVKLYATKRVSSSSNSELTLTKDIKAPKNEENAEKCEKDSFTKAATELVEFDATRPGCSSSNSDSNKDIKAPRNEETAEKSENGKE